MFKQHSAEIQARFVSAIFRLKGWQNNPAYPNINQVTSVNEIYRSYIQGMPMCENRLEYGECHEDGHYLSHAQARMIAILALMDVADTWEQFEMLHARMTKRCLNSGSYHLVNNEVDYQKFMDAVDAMLKPHPKK